LLGVCLRIREFPQNLWLVKNRDSDSNRI